MLWWKSFGDKRPFKKKSAFHSKNLFGVEFCFGGPENSDRNLFKMAAAETETDSDSDAGIRPPTCPVRFFSLVQKKSVILIFFAPLMNKDDFLFGLPERFLSSSETSEKVKTKSFEEKEIGQKVPKNISYPELEFGSWHPGTKELEVERVWAQARRPGPKFWLLVNKPQARGSATLVCQKARSRLEGYFGRFRLVRAWKIWVRSTSTTGIL